ncbi:MAG: Re/Si-specific NAD(P)(+) transhydrogenase subunit alpha [Candidatus Omnitrophica bacterium]|nr:Re/Si-specific NAD(P)(+) transhydrogenase subunit alpha [Candidatus Omnitrophota bacterium]
MRIGIPKETYPNEQRVALIPANLPQLQKAGHEILVESGAGDLAGYPDASYREKGAQVVSSRKELFEKAGILAQVRLLGANPKAGASDASLYRKGQVLFGFSEPLWAPGGLQPALEKGVTHLSMELIPRITRAQSMDALSSMGTIAGYKSVLLAANTLPKMFPMFMTAAGTVSPAKVLIIGVGVAGLQAIATAKRLGAVVQAYDIRPAVKEQVQSLGAKFVELDLETGDAEDKGGYAKEKGEEFLARQRELMGDVLAGNDVVITTAAIPGRKSPILVTQPMVEKMAPRSVIIDIAAERGGNCELTKPDQVVEHKGVTILGPANLPSTVPYHASQMYSKNLTTLLLHLTKEGKLEFNMEDEIVSGTLVCQGGEVLHERVKEALAPAGGKA